jgi:hypothetical protein
VWGLEGALTALQFMTQFRWADVRSVGRKDDLCWALVDVDEDGTEAQSLFIMERAGVVRVIQNLDVYAQVQVRDDPLPFWGHPRAEAVDG